MERIKKDIIASFKKLNLKIVIESNMKIVNFLDVTLNLSDGSFSPCRKPNDESLYINSMSNHPPNIIKHLPKSINRRISSLSCNEDHLNNVKHYYEDQLKSCGYNELFSFMNETPANNRNKTRKRNIIWFNPPYSQSVKSNVFLKLVRSHFPKTHRFHKILNKNNVNVSYSCMNNMTQIIKSHNSKILNNNNIINKNRECNCRRKAECPLDNQCLSRSLVYKASVIPTVAAKRKYLGLTEGIFKDRFNKYKTSFHHDKYQNSTELSKYAWSLQDNNDIYHILWEIVEKATPYSNIPKRCNLCLTEKFHIITSNDTNLLNKRSELISKCVMRISFI